MGLDATLERTAAPNVTDLVDAFATYVDGHIDRDAAPEDFFHATGIAIQDVLYARNGCADRFEDVPAEYVIALSAYLPEIAKRTLSSEAAREVARSYADFFSER